MNSSTAIEEARTSLEKGNAEQAIRILLQYLQAHPDDPAARVTLGQSYALVGQNDLAEREFEAVLSTSPNNFIALAALGELYEKAGALQNAETMLARAAVASHEKPQIRTEWAYVLARLHRYKEAESALAGVPPPKDAKEGIAFHRLKASVASGLGKSTSAAAEMEKALELNPDDLDLKLATAVAETQNKNWARAASLAAPMFSQTHDPQIGLVLLSAQLEMKTDYHQTLDALRAADLPAAEGAALRQRLAEILISHGHLEESVEDLKQAAQLEPNQANLIFNLALAEYRGGQLAEALASAEKCKALRDSAEIEDLLGDIQESRGDNLAAVRSYQAAVARAPQEEKYRLSLALELIRHKSFDAARVVLQQAEESFPQSWRLELAMGMVEYFTGTDEKATRLLLRAASLAPEPLAALTFLGKIQMDQVSTPEPAALTRLCRYSDSHPREGKMAYYCGALLFRRDYTSGTKTNVKEILRRLRAASQLLPDDASPHCELGKAYRWMERWQDALHESESCTRMDPDSAEAHYRLAQIYQHLGQRRDSLREMKLYETASTRVADENARRDETIKTFVYTIQKEVPDQK